MPRGLGRTQKAVLASIQGAARSVREIAQSVGSSPRIVRQSLRRLEARGMAEPVGLEWSRVAPAGPLFDQGRPGFDLLQFLAACVAFVEQDGYLSRADAALSNRTATPDKALGFLAFRAAGQAPTANLWIDRNSRQDWIGYRVTAERVAVGVSARIRRSSKGEYEKSLLGVFRDRVVTAETAGYAASMFGFSDRSGERKAQIDWAAARDASDYFGNPGERLALSILVNKAKPFDGYYAKKTMIQFLADDGVGVWWASSLVTWARVGERYNVRATVSDHKLNEHGGTPFRETIVKCVKLVSEEEGAKRFAERLERHG